MKRNILEPAFLNKIIDKAQLKQYIVWAFRNYGIARAANMADKLKDLGFYYATKAGISLSLEDLRIPPIKQQLLDRTLESIAHADNRYKRGEITAVERFQRVIDTWNNASDTLKQEVVRYFKNTDPLNSIYMMAFSGARANISQVRQLVGMRGLMSDPQGQIIDLPIYSNFREGLTVTDYFISSYGARKGLVDTALRTADSGYLTRRLVDVAQDVIIREFNCKTSKGILLEEMIDNQKVLISLKQSLLGRVLAEDIWDLHSNSIIAHSGEDIQPILAEKIVNLGIKSVLVRSPITCDSIRSVCQLCYGWNLAHGRMVDLGEAVGIIAAQSIGEPGTQLTMRTFHTGGVFTGELAQTILSPVDAELNYPNNIILSNTRTRHGDPAMLVMSDCKLTLITADKLTVSISLIKGSLLLVNNKSLIAKGDIIAEYPLSNRIVTERAQKAVVTDLSGSISLTHSSTEKKNDNLRSITDGEVIWVLSGKVYNIPDDAELIISEKQVINENSLLARTQVISRYNGRVSIVNTDSSNIGQQISIITSCKTFIDLKVFSEISDGCTNYILEAANQDKFILTLAPQQNIVNEQIIASLVSDMYTTKTGGIIKYLDLSISKKTTKENKNDYNIIGSGYILWIPEETYEINKDISLLLVKHGQFVESGTEIIKNLFANNSGILEVIHRDGIIREIIIKPGKMYLLDNRDIHKKSGKYRGFLKPGQIVIDGIITHKLVYWEYIRVNDQNYILIRPVIVYSIIDKKLKFNYSDDSFATDTFNLELVRRTYFRDGERVKSVSGINLVRTYLVAKLKPEARSLKCTIDFIRSYFDSSSILLKFITYDNLSIKDSFTSNDQNIYAQTSLLVENHQEVMSGSVVGQTEIFSVTEGKVEYIQDNQLSNRRILIVNASDMRTFFIANNQSIKLSINDWVYAGDQIANDVVTYDSGQVIAIGDNQVTIRIGQPYLISRGSFLHIQHNALVQRGENIATLIFERAKTGDIVQGLPRIEEILEARKKADSSFNPHIMLDTKFRSYLNKGLSLYDSTRLSLLDVQLFLVKEIQLVYQCQGVDISDKHIEIIVRQMTSKVKIENGGDSDYLPGEMIELQKIEFINKSLEVMNKQPASYHPILLGITKASLNTESFISAASFQETTKVLTEAAISGKLDWLRGLKENVIIGRLIPAGTGFNIYNNSLLNNTDIPNESNSLNTVNTLSSSSPSDFEDIILDDRIARSYPISFESSSKKI
uniref:plastid-encoded DNA-directed RNA polymerase subunit beta'' n=1 Tax=Grateloupia asiatica TaxID=151735 RepID=UPI002A80906C|nr:plastid-encoded DNA-directed RNA polymerase subunit beta'' [Grateloupia asiatica]WOL36909.1 plastid-encoded DNA-directed RNA polymerase subunit beta'' [Grateloupia asiatica]